MSTEFRYVGQSLPVVDAARKATGDLRYGSDLTRPGMLFAKLVLSPHAHAVVEAVHGERALQVPGVVGVYSHVDAPSTMYCRYRIVPDQDGCIDDEAVFASTARHVGDRVAAVVATSLAAAIEGARLVDVQYSLLPAALTPEAALAPGAGHLHPGGNLVHEFDHVTGTAGSVSAADTAAGVTTHTTSVATQMLHHAALEPHMCLADFDAGKLTVWSPCQSVYGARTVVADLFGLPYNKVRVIKVPMGGSFGGKQEVILEPVVSFLAMATGRPVKLVLDREECISATMVRPAQRTTVRTTMSSDGVLLDLDLDTVLNAGGYSSSSPGYAESMAHKLTRLYRTPRYRHHARVVCTNTPVGGGMRGWGAPDIVTCIEIHLDQVAKRMGIDPVALRMRNLVHPGDFDQVSGRSLGDARVQQCLERGAEMFGWEERVAASPGTGRYRRAVGVACGGHKNGMLGHHFPESSTMTLKMNEDGSVDVNATIHEVGADTAGMVRQVVAEELGIDSSLISVGEADSETTPFDFGCFGSRMTYVVGAGARMAARRLADVVAQAAAELLEAAPADLIVADGRVEVAGVPGGGLSFAQVVQRRRMLHGQDVVVTNTYTGRSNPGSYSVQFAEVEVDVLTGLVEVTDFLTVVDIGTAINPASVIGQCRGAAQAGIGSALCEEVVIDGHGRPLDGGFKNYHLVNAAGMPDVKVLLIEHEADDGPFGAKSVGEVAFVPTAAAVVNAVNRALGTEITELPASPDRIVAALAALPMPVGGAAS